MERGTLETATVRKRSDEPSTAVVMAVAAARGIDPIDLDCRLTDAVDPDALDRLYTDDRRRASTTPELEFSLGGCSVTVHEDGSVSATETSV